jgi:hypothetical protein
MRSFLRYTDELCLQCEQILDKATGIPLNRNVVFLIACITTTGNSRLSSVPSGLGLCEACPFKAEPPCVSPDLALDRTAALFSSLNRMLHLVVCVAD